MALTTHHDNWIARPGRGLALHSTLRPARLRLFLFPYAGGGASLFRGWAAGLPAEVDVCPVQLPGREERIGEAPFARLATLAPVLAQVLRSHLDLPFVLFGYSLGALICFELARRLRRRFGLRPAALLAAACPAPQLAPASPALHGLPQDRLLAELRGMNGTSETFFQDPDLQALFLPVLRADFSMYDTYTYTDEPPLDCPITVFGGLNDPRVSPAALAAWQRQTSSRFNLRTFAGDHFFMRSQGPALQAALAEELAACLAAVEGA